MVKNLNRLSFSPFGKVLIDRHPNRGFPEGGNWKEEVISIQRSQARVCRLDADWMYLDFSGNMTVLAVGHCPEHLEYFYLDKPVSIPRGTYFALLPIFDSCTVRCCMQEGGRWTSQEGWTPDMSFSISRQMTISSIYTIFYQEKEKGFFFKGESHEAAELIYVDKGSLHSVVNGVETILNQGNMIVYGPNQWHMQYADLDCSANFITISFDVQCPFLELLLNRRFSLDSDAAGLLQQILKERESPDMFSDDMIISKLQQLLLMVLRMEHPDVDKLRTSVSLYNENKIINRAQAYIADNVYSKLSVSQVAGAINVSASYLTALFHRHLQIGPGEYIRRTKLEESKKLIREGRENFTQIAKLLQYSTVHHFSRRFKMQFGVTPTQYSKSIHFTESHPEDR